MLTKGLIDHTVNQAKKNNECLALVFVELSKQAHKQYRKACKEATPGPAKKHAEIIGHINEVWEKHRALNQLIAA